MTEAPLMTSPDGSRARNDAKAPLLSPPWEMEEPHIETLRWSAWADLDWKLCVRSGLMDSVQSKLILLRNLMEQHRMASAADRVLGPNDHMWSSRKARFLSSTSIWLSLDYAFRVILIICSPYSTDQRVQVVHLQEKIEILMQNPSHLVSHHWCHF